MIRSKQLFLNNWLWAWNIYLFEWLKFDLTRKDQIKSLLLSHHHSTSALVSKILKRLLQTVQKNKNKTIYILTDRTEDNVQKKHIHILSTHSVL